MPSNSFSIFAPAKINLFLHITGKRGDGYHLLQSLIAFADVGDELVFSVHDGLEIGVEGPFAAELGDAKDNLIYKAALLLSAHYKITAHAKITLSKNLPVASGLGGGSSDAAAALKGLRKLWRLPDEPEALARIALQLGADVPVCLYQKTAWAEGIGDQVTFLPEMPEMHLVLVNPCIPTATAAVFKRFDGPFSPSIPVSVKLPDLKNCRNDLTAAAIAVTPEIADVLNALAQTPDCFFQRLSGSGATCFGVYSTAESAQAAVAALRKQYPLWWIKSTNVLK